MHIILLEDIKEDFKKFSFGVSQFFFDLNKKNKFSTGIIFQVTRKRKN